MEYEAGFILGFWLGVLIAVPYEDIQIEKNGDVPEYLELIKRAK